MAGAFYLVADRFPRITFLSVALYIVPMILEGYRAFKGKPTFWLAVLIRVLGFALLAFCACGIAGAFADAGSSFVGPNESLFHDLSISKTVFAWLLFGLGCIGAFADGILAALLSDNSDTQVSRSSPPPNAQGVQESI
jgi:hypothetical protein